MIKLLMRFYDVNSGAIKIDGHNIKDFNRSELRPDVRNGTCRIPGCSSGSIEDNIKYGKLDATHEEVVVEAAKAAHGTPVSYRHCREDITWSLNEEASNVSQGQKQLLTIATSDPGRSEDPDPR